MRLREFVHGAACAAGVRAAARLGAADALDGTSPMRFTTVMDLLLLDAGGACTPGRA